MANLAATASIVADSSFTIPAPTLTKRKVVKIVAVPRTAPRVLPQVPTTPSMTVATATSTRPALTSSISIKR